MLLGGSSGGKYENNASTQNTISLPYGVNVCRVANMQKMPNETLESSHDVQEQGIVQLRIQ